LALAGGVPVWLIATFVVLLGLAFGSFLNVCISRLPRHESIVQPGSRCPKCRNAIRAWDNVPVLSWMFLRGRCRVCRWRIPWRYPAVEVATAALFLLCFLQFGLTISSAGVAVFCFLMLGLAVMDAETMRLPNAFTWPGIGLGVVFAGITGGEIVDRLGAGFLAFGSIGTESEVWFPLPFGLGAAVPAMLLSAFWALLAALLILAVRWIYFAVRHREGMGLGDAKLLAMIAAWLGPQFALLSLFLGVVGAAMVGLAWMILRGRRSALTMRLPFGAFLCAAAIFAVFAGRPILEWYLMFFR
jgi:leader peptidase (prepilin peptidase)/N-methyltransferase